MKKNIKDVAPLLAYHVVDFEVDRNFHQENWNQVVNNSKRLGLYHKYMNLLHDSWFIKTSITDDKFSILINDFTTHVFSDVIVDRKKLKIAHNKLVFPIQIDFEITDLTFYTVDYDGFIIEIDPPRIDEYLHEQIIAIDDNNIEIALLVWEKENKKRNRGYVLILINARNITLIEYQDKAWSEIFGNGYDDYYNYFRSEFNNGRYLSNQQNCYELYNEYERLHVNK